LYALACQVKPDITPEELWEKAFETSSALCGDDGSGDAAGRVVDPAKLIESVEGMD